jgi:glycosyltransferase, family 2
MKTISILVPTYNEEENIPLIYDRIKKIFGTSLSNYNFELIYIDNYSLDRSREIIEELSEKDSRVKAIFNAKNFGFSRSCFYGLLQGTGDCTVLIFADMQDPPEVIVDFVKEWEKGNQIVIGIKNRSRENPIMYLIRGVYYKIIKKIADIDHIEQFTGFGLYDKKFIDVMKQLKDSNPYLRGIVAELGPERAEVYYEQKQRERGKSTFNFFKLYDVAMLGITSYSKVVMRLATIMGFLMSGICFILGIITIVMKLINWDSFQLGLAGLSVGMFFMGSVILFFIGFLGEYILNINIRVMDRPLVIEQKRVGFKEEDKE